MSEHEGFGVPLVEAMLMGVPVLAHRAAAVPDTLGAAGVQFGEKRLDEVAEMAHLLATDAALRARGAGRPAAAAPGLRARGGGGRAPGGYLDVAVSERAAFVVQRYGADITGGSESLARAVAERLARGDAGHACSPPAPATT